MLTINGRFLAARTTGVQRVAQSLISELNRQADGEELRGWRLLRPPGARAAGLSRLAEVELGPFRGQAWEQFVLPGSAKSSTILNLCNTGPILSDRNLVMIHDAQVFLTPTSYSRAFRIWYEWLLPQLGRRALKVLTVSEYSKQNLVRFGVAEAERITVVPNGCDHLVSIRIDRGILARLALGARPFVVMMSSLQAHKNVDVVLRAFELPDLAGVALVLVGRDGEAAYRAAGRTPPAAVVFAGPLSDGELRGLLEQAVALACPSLTEGFGLPPLEAMSVGCPAVVAPEGALPEVCREAAGYADAGDPAAWAQALAALLDPRLRARRLELGRQRAARYSWAESGRQLLAVVRETSELHL